MLCGVILAGGQGRRMGGDKAFTLLAGKPLIAWVEELLTPQVDVLVISGQPGQVGQSDLPVLPDSQGLSGPAAGVMAGLQWAQEQGAEGLLVVPCDMPFLPADLLETLQSKDAVCVPAIAGRALWAVSFWPQTAIAAALSVPRETNTGSKGLALRSLIKARQYTVLPMTNEDSFCGINTPDALAAAETWVRETGETP